MRQKDKIHIKTAAEIEKMRVAGKLAASVLDYVAPFVRAGVSTGELDSLCHQYIIAQDAVPAPLGYNPAGDNPYPNAVCTSINHQVCHGVPSFERFLKDGDILNIDVTVIKNGWHGDTARMFCIGKPSVLAARLCRVTLECLQLGIAAARPGNRTGNIGRAIQQHAESHGYSVVRDFCGHGLGAHFHEAPQILHYTSADKGAPLLPNMVFTIEPMINAGGHQVKVLADKWTAVTRDRSLSAQWEHTVRITENECEVLTKGEN